jgi:hypothetical protein
MDRRREGARRGRRHDVGRDDGRRRATTCAAPGRVVVGVEPAAGAGPFALRAEVRAAR